ncbi:phage portal protein [Roseovarius sp.]|uniref:phage portal protein n=1 Tax=Roseovarius sp. TaxID=1486281 RepID=UPI003D10C1FF
MGGFVDRFAPRWALRREVARAQLDLLRERRAERNASAPYAPVGGGRRSREFYRNSRDPHGTISGARQPLAYIARDMLRNNPRVTRANNLFAGYVVGSGIRPVVEMVSEEDKGDKSRIEGLIEDHLLTTAIDADGHSTLFGMQNLALKTIPLSGEVLLRYRQRRTSDGLPLPFQIQCLETDYIAHTKHTLGSPQGRRIENGIEYGPTGAPEAYHLYANHPGSQYGTGDIRRVMAENIAHAFLVDRPGQRRGVSWYAPVMAELHDLHKFMQGTLKRQEVAAMFAGILKRTGDDDAGDDLKEALLEIEAGGIAEIQGSDELEFTEPPSAQSAEPIVKIIDRVIASGLMLTYEGFSGDYSQVNYTSGRMGRMDQDPMIQFWQNELAIARLMGPVTRWFKEALYFKTFIEPDKYRLRWTAPRRPVVDPTKDYPALIRKIRGGLATRADVIREMGQDPERIWNEWSGWAARDDEAGLVFDSDPRRVSLSGVAQAKAASANAVDETLTDEDETDD